jgi:hypothetical protein
MEPLAEEANSARPSCRKSGMEPLAEARPGFLRAVERQWFLVLLAMAA